MAFRIKRGLALALVCALMLGMALPAFAWGPSPEPTYKGMDVSEYQGSIDYAKVKESGVEIVYIRASVGNSFQDPYFLQNYQNAKAAGLKVGFYHYLTAVNTLQAQQQAQFFASLMAKVEPDCRLAMDYELFSGLDADTVNAIALEFMQTTERLTGLDMVVYSDYSNARYVFSSQIAQTYPLWIAQYGVEEPSDPGTWENWVGFQYGSGSVNGVPQKADLDYFTSGILLSSAPEPEPEPDPEPEPEPEPGTGCVYYTVKRYDTLTRIAARYHTTVSWLVQKNHIQNPDLILVGQRLCVKESGPSQQVRYVVQKGDTLWSIAQRFSTTVNALVQANHIANPNLILIGQVLYIP